MRLRWTQSAADNLEHIRNYLTQYHPQFANSTVLELYEAIRSLKTSANRGRPGREKGTREFVLPRLPYIVVYRVKGDAIEILHIYHGAQNRP